MLSNLNLANPRNLTHRSVKEHAKPREWPVGDFVPSWIRGTLPPKQARKYLLRIPIEEGRNATGSRNLTCKPRPESGTDCRIRFIFTRQRSCSRCGRRQCKLLPLFHVGPPIFSPRALPRPKVDKFVPHPPYQLENTPATPSAAEG